MLILKNICKVDQQNVCAQLFSSARGIQLRTNTADQGPVNGPTQITC